MDATLKQRARSLRKSQTDAEKKLWQALRNRQLHGFKFRRQVVVGNYIVDFLCREAQLVIELDGGQHTDHQNYDQQRTQYLSQQGFTVIRFWNHQALEQFDDVLESVLSYLNPHR